MSDYVSLEFRFLDTLGITRRPVAITFRDTVPVGIAKFTGVQPSSCSYWRIAEGGRSFYTVAGDHYNCPIGSYTHNTPLPKDREPELMQTLTLLGEIGYVKMEEIPGIFKLPQPPAYVVYSPLGDAAAEPSVVLFSGKPARVMLLVEAATRAGAMSPLPLLARPTCMALPAALQSGVVASAGCIGNRVYTEINEDELYVAVPGRDLERVANEMHVIATANRTLAGYHRARRESLTTA